MKKSRIAALALGAVILCGCSGIDGALYGKSTVMRIVKDAVPDEKYEYTGVDRYYDERPKREVYHFSSKDRDLVFDATNTLSEIWFDGGTGLYEKRCEPGYASAVFGLYDKQIHEAMAAFENASSTSTPNDFSYRGYYDSYKELAVIAEQADRADMIYSAELEYNTAEWMKDHPMRSVELGYHTPSRSYDTAEFSINGTWGEGRLRDYILFRHIQLVKEEGLNDPSIPAEMYEATPVSRIGYIFVNGVNITDRIWKNEISKYGLVQFEKKNYGIRYSYEHGSYMIPMDGLRYGNEDYGPGWIKEYAAALGIEAEYENVMPSKGRITWSNGGDRYRVDACYSKKTYTVKKNGIDMNIDHGFFDATDDSPVEISWAVGVSVDDFAEIFGLDYEIITAENRIDFTSRK